MPWRFNISCNHMQVCKLLDPRQPGLLRVKIAAFAKGHNELLQCLAIGQHVTIEKVDLATCTSLSTKFSVLGELPIFKL